MMRLWNNLGCAIMLATVLSLTGAWTQGRSDVVSCSLAGVNPADHPGSFGNPDVARKQFGFVKGRDGNWHVIRPCHIRS
jgi:hypothetical protein